MTNPLDELGTAAGKAFFNRDSQIGATVTGTILDATVRQVTDFQTGKPKFWDDGSPQQQVVITLKTDLREDADDEGDRSLYIKTWGTQWRALQEAVRNIGASKLSEALAPGNIMSAAFTGTKKAGNGFDEKLYAYRIERGASPALDTVAAAAPAAAAAADPWNQPPAPQPTQQATPAAPAQPDPAALIAAGLADQQILGMIPALDPNILAMLRAQNA